MRCSTVAWMAISERSTSTIILSNKETSNATHLYFQFSKGYMMNDTLLLPNPRSLTFSGGQYTLAPGRRIVVQAAETGELLFSAQRLQAALRQHADVDWELSATLAG